MTFDVRFLIFDLLTLGCTKLAAHGHIKNPTSNKRLISITFKILRRQNILKGILLDVERDLFGGASGEAVRRAQYGVQEGVDDGIADLIGDQPRVAFLSGVQYLAGLTELIAGAAGGHPGEFDDPARLLQIGPGLPVEDPFPRAIARAFDIDGKFKTGAESDLPGQVNVPAGSAGFAHLNGGGNRGWGALRFFVFGTIETP